MVTTGLWFSMRSSWFSLAHSNKVYIIAVPRLASTCSSSFDRISCFVSAELLKFNTKERNTVSIKLYKVQQNSSITLWLCTWSKQKPFLVLFKYPMCTLVCLRRSYLQWYLNSVFLKSWLQPVQLDCTNYQKHINPIRIIWIWNNLNTLLCFNSNFQHLSTLRWQETTVLTLHKPIGVNSCTVIQFRILQKAQNVSSCRFLMYHQCFPM